MSERPDHATAFDPMLRYHGGAPPPQIIGSGWIWEDWDDSIRVRLTRTHCELTAAPQPDQAYRERALALGYRSSAEMNRHHDLLHLCLTDWLSDGQLVSPVVTAVAQGQLAALPEWQVWGEEGLVLTFARYVETGVPGPELVAFTLRALDPAFARTRFLTMLTGLRDRSPTPVLPLIIRPE